MFIHVLNRVQKLVEEISFDCYKNNYLMWRHWLHSDVIFGYKIVFKVIIIKYLLVYVA